MNIQIRQETETDYDAVFNVIEEAFKSVSISDKTEQYLVQRLRKSPAFIPELSLVAECDGQLVGHILLTKLKINNKEDSFDALALAPVSVLPEFQANGIGGKLIIKAHEIARELGHTSVILIGHEQYYPRFGYKRLDQFGIEMPFAVPKENCMAIELIPNALKEVNGMVEYPRAFMG